MIRPGSEDATGTGPARGSTVTRIGRLGLWWLLAGGVVAGVLLLIGGQIRLGGRTLGCAFLGAALVRLVTPENRGGALVVRSRTIDVWCLLAAGLAVLAAGEMVTLS